jgi:hypothetical protein
MLGRDGNIMDGECSPSLEMLKEVEIQWMRSASHHASHINFKSYSTNGERSPLPFSMLTKKVAL